MGYSLEDWRGLGTQRQLLSHSIFTIDTGKTDKPALLLLHGYPSASWDYERLFDQLDRQYRVVALDFLGFGWSDKPNPYNYRIVEQADLVEALCSELDLTDLRVLTHDYGVTVAQELLARQNQSKQPYWHSVCFLNGGLFPETHRARLIQKLLLSPIGPWLSKFLKQSSFEKSFSAVFGEFTKPNQEVLDGLWQLIEHNQGRHMFHNLISYMNDRIEHRERWVDALQNAVVPVGLINGNADPVSGKHLVERFQELIQGQHFIRHLPELGHYPQVENPQAVLAAFTEFQQSVSMTIE